MKKLTGYALLIIVLSSILAFDGCKRGDDDPFFSIRSRKARVTGDWTFEAFESIINKHFSSTGYDATVDFKLTRNNISIKVDSIHTTHDTTKTTNGIVKEATYRFDKNSKMEYRFDYELTWINGNGVGVTDENTNITTLIKIVTNVRIRAYGTWNFISNVEKNGVHKYKNKERLSLIFETFNENTQVVSTTEVTDEEGTQISFDYTATSESYEHKYANGENAQIWVLQELRNNKIVMNRDIDYLEVSNTDSIGTSYQQKGNETATLKPTK